MITEIYALKDTKIAFKQPFLQQNRAVAFRTATWMANEQKENELEDIELWQLGEYDDETGFIKPMNPQFVCKLIDLRREK